MLKYRWCSLILSGLLIVFFGIMGDQLRAFWNPSDITALMLRGVIGEPQLGPPLCSEISLQKKKIPPKKSFVWRNQSNLVSRSNRTFIFMKSYCRNTFVFDFSLSFFFLLPLNSQGIYSSEVWGPQRVWAYWYNPPHRGQFDVSG